MKFAQNNHPTLLFSPTRLFGTWEYLQVLTIIHVVSCGKSERGFWHHRKNLFLFFNFCWISHLSPIKFPTLSTRTEMFPTLSLDIFRFGFGLVWLWNVQNSWDLIRPRLSYTFLFFYFQNFLSVELKCFSHYKSDGIFLIRL